MNFKAKPKRRHHLSKAKLSHDDLLSNYASQQGTGRTASIEKIISLSATMPYAVSVGKIQESMRITDHLKSLSFDNNGSRSILTKANDFDDGLLSATTLEWSQHAQLSQFYADVSVTSLKKRYPRLCAYFKLEDDDLLSISTRSDLWMVHFIEECFDAAMISCCRANSSNFKTICGLDLGEMDSFPLVVKRLLSRTFSVLKVRDKMCLEMLVTLHSIMQCGDPSSAVFGQPDSRRMEFANSSVIDAFRATMFSKFLSEEYDASYLAIFLHARDVVQNNMGFRLVDINQSKIWVDTTAAPAIETATTIISEIGSPGLAAITDTGSRKHRAAAASKSQYILGPKTHIGLSKSNDYYATTSADRGDKMKVVPLKLPLYTHFCHDFTLPEAPAIGFELSLLPSICSMLLPIASVRQRLYLADRILDTSQSFIEKGRMWQRTLRLYTRNEPVKQLQSRQSSGNRYEHDNDNDKVKDDDIGDRAVNVDGKLVVPFYAVFLTLCEEWKRVPESVKVPVDAFTQTTLNLRELHKLYQHDCELKKSLLQEISTMEVKLTVCNAGMARSEKVRRKLERKWIDGLADQEDLDQLVAAKVAVVEGNAERITLVSELDQLQRKRKALEANIESLWSKVNPEGERQRALQSKKRKENNRKKRRGAAGAGGTIATTTTAAIAATTDSTGMSAVNGDSDAELEGGEGATMLLQSVDDSSLGAVGAVEDDGDEKDLGQLALKKSRSSKINNMRLKALLLAPGAASSAETGGNVQWREKVIERLMIAVKYFEKIKRDEEEARRPKLVQPPPPPVDIAVDELKSAVEPMEVAVVEESPINVEEQDDSAARELRWALQEQERRAREIQENSRLLQEMLTLGADAYLERQNEREKKKLEAERREKEQAMAAIRHLCAVALVVGVIDDAVEGIAEAIVWRQQDTNTAARLLARNTMQIIEKAALSSASRTIEAMQLRERQALCESLAEAATAIATESLITSIYNEHFTIEIDLYIAVEDDKYMRAKAAADAEAAFHRTVQQTVALILSSAAQSAAGTLCDPWLPLEWDPSSWLSPTVLNTVEQRRENSLKMFKMLLLRLGFHLISRDWRVKKLVVRRNKKLMAAVMQVFKECKSESLRRREESAIRIQYAVRHYCARKQRRVYAVHVQSCTLQADDFQKVQLRGKARKMVKFWRKLILVKWRGYYVAEWRKTHCTRSTFTAWRALKVELQEQHRLEHIRSRAALRLILTRSMLFMSRRRAKRQVAARKIQLLYRRCQLAGRIRQRISRQQVLAEKREAIAMKAVFLYVKRSWKVWHRLHSFHKGLQQWDAVLSRILYQKALNHWKDRSSSAKSLERKHAQILQSVVRMWLCKKHVLDYYRWRRALHVFQACSRRAAVRKKFLQFLPYHRGARQFQRLYRGYRVRDDLTNRRVRDLHYASSANNYERLMYYVNKYPELVTEIDEDGNSALHNAAKTASRRTLKLAAKCNLDMNALNFYGFSPLHLAIASTAVNRDDVCLYMIEHGFDDHQKTGEGKTCLLLAVENGRAIIAKHLLEFGADPNIPDDSGNTCLQSACAQGLYTLVSDLIEHGADVNMPGYCGTYPLHDCLAARDVDIAKLLLYHEAALNVYEPYHYQTPLMWACRAGLPAIVDLFILQGGDLHAKDVQGRSAAHHGAYSDSEDVYNSLREADVNFDETDNEGNTVLHVAAECGAANFAKHLLAGGCNPSMQNTAGDQASHIAARFNYVEILRTLSAYDEHISRINFQHQTPLGAAKFACATDAQAFLEEHYRKIFPDGARRQTGEIFWEKDFSGVVDPWQAVANRSGQRAYVSTYTGDVIPAPPILAAALVEEAARGNIVPTKKKMLPVNEENTLNRHAYLLEVAEFREDVSGMKKLHVAAVIIQCLARKHHARKVLRYKRFLQLKRLQICRFIMRYKDKFFNRQSDRNELFVIRIQAAWRSHALRSRLYYTTNWYNELVYRRSCLRLAKMVLRLWRGYRFYQTVSLLVQEMHAPRTRKQWDDVIALTSGPIRVLGAVEEYISPGTTRSFFYRNTVTKVCTFIKPKKLRVLDQQSRAEAVEFAKLGYTRRQVHLATRVQAIWRGHTVRTYAHYVEKALEISLSVERAYMSDPDKDSNLYNFALHCFVVLQDYDRARGLFAESIRRMVWRGPDVAFVLYSYAVYNFVTHDLDYSDVLLYLERGRRAEENRDELIRRKRGETEVHDRIMAAGSFRYGKVFEQARIGFFKHTAKERNDGQSWHNYAAVQFLIYNDFVTSFDAFLYAFQFDKSGQKMRANFDIMMHHYHGNDKLYLAQIVDARMQELSMKDLDSYAAVIERKELAYKRQLSVRVIQDWYRRCLWDRKTLKFRETAMQIKERKIASRRKRLTALARFRGEDITSYDLEEAL